ncbi:MAG: EAL domain-containing protein [Hyphomicrobiaceae bacterium]
MFRAFPRARGVVVVQALLSQARVWGAFGAAAGAWAGRIRIAARFGTSSVAMRLRVLAVVLLTAVSVLVAAAIFFAHQTERATHGLLEGSVSARARAAEIQILIERHRRLVESAPLAAPFEAEAVAGHLSFVERAIELLLQDAANSVPIDTDLPLQTLFQAGHQVLQAVNAGRSGAVRDATERYVEQASALDHAMNRHRQHRQELATAGMQRLESIARQLVVWVVLFGSLAVLVIGGVAVIVRRSVFRRLSAILDSMTRLARNDTSIAVPSLEDPDEIGAMARAVAVFKANSIELQAKTTQIEGIALQLDAAVNNMPLGLSMYDASHRLLVCNKRYAEMYSLPPHLTRAGASYADVLAYRMAQGGKLNNFPMLDVLDPSRMPSPPPFSTIEMSDSRVLTISRQPIKGGGWVAVHEDVTLRRQQEAQIFHLARHDQLTNLANRVLFLEQMQAALAGLARGEGFALLCLDLDNFKTVNDTLGHPTGDQLLRLVAERLLECVRPTDVVARLGGDEFAIIQAGGGGREAAEALAQRIVTSLCRPYMVDDQQLLIGVSIGATRAPTDGSDASELLKNADLALYRSKSEGRGTFTIYQPEMNERIRLRRSLELDLRKALADGQFELHYQPIVCLKTQAITAFEALLRWNHPQRGMVPPGDFIPLAEELGLICDIGEWTLRTACSTAARWPQSIKVAVNLSPLQFARQNLSEFMFHALATSGLSPDRLEIEITESVLLQDSPQTTALLYQLRKLGIRISMDDFGTGYSSLSYLRSFPFDTIKIDRAFITDIATSAESRAIVEAIVNLSTSLGTSTVAEGIETEAQLDGVRAVGCTQAQGFLYSRPVPAGQVEGLLAKGARARDAA